MRMQSVSLLPRVVLVFIDAWLVSGMFGLYQIECLNDNYEY